jgi:chemotaxis family two-component system response regulator Rcp1
MLKTILTSSIDILLIEHNFDNSYEIQKFLKEKIPFNRIHTVRDGIEAIDFFRNEGIIDNSIYFCILMIDLNVPYCREVFEEINKDKNLKNLPLIILTEMNESDLLKTYKLPLNYQLVKPVDLTNCFEVKTSGNILMLQFNEVLPARRNSYLM